MINTHKQRNGQIVSAQTLEALLATGSWLVTGISQVVDGESYFRVENDDAMDYCLASADDCKKAFEQ